MIDPKRKRTKRATQQAVFYLLGRGWTRQKIAERFGVDRRTVLNWQTGTTKPHPRVFADLMVEVDG